MRRLFLRPKGGARRRVEIRSFNSFNSFSSFRASGAVLASAVALVAVAAAALVAVAPATFFPTAVAQGHPARSSRVDPIGVWHCLMYGSRRDERFYLALGDGNVARIARARDAGERRWLALEGWHRNRDTLEIEDAWNGRQFFGDLRAASLGGRWSARRDTGGWWCARVEGAAPADPEPPPAAGLMMSPRPAIMASPNYPREAIREAKEGRVVSCFIVDGQGRISRPGLIELTDEIFRDPTLEAVVRSTYWNRGDDDAPVPACRSFEFELRAAG